MLNLFRRKPKPVYSDACAPSGRHVASDDKTLAHCVARFPSSTTFKALPDLSFDVDFAKPDTRFRPGQSGNPLGRPPSDPEARNLREARRIAARMYRAMPFTGGGGFAEKRAAAIEAGHRDTAPEVLSVLEGVRRGRELERAAPTLGKRP